jgi:hypothetical protein
MPNPEFPFTYQEQASCAKREASLRRSVYKKQAGTEPIPAGKQREIDLMESIAAHFEALATKPPVRYATGEQKEEIIRLLNHPLVTRPEKTKMLLALNRIEEERALSAISNIRQAIELREEMPTTA